MRAALAALAAISLASCASSKPTGNELGGVVMHGGMHPEQAFEAAQRHCQTYGKSARITNIKVQDYSGDPVLFDCV
jgi:hypothetical protein